MSGGYFLGEGRPTDEQCFVCLREGLEPAQLFSYGGSTTLVAFTSPPGHDHDDNCHAEDLACERGHHYSVRRRNTCPACDWKGHEECFCHPLGVRIYDSRKQNPPWEDVLVYGERVNKRVK